MRAVIDTGVFVSALIRRQGTTGDVLRSLRDGRFTAIYYTTAGRTLTPDKSVKGYRTRRTSPLE